MDRRLLVTIHQLNVGLAADGSVDQDVCGDIDMHCRCGPLREGAGLKAGQQSAVTVNTKSSQGYSHDPLSMVASSSKFKADKSVHPGTSDEQSGMANSRVSLTKVSVTKYIW